MKTLLYILVLGLIGLGIYSYYNPDFLRGLMALTGETFDVPKKTVRAYKWRDAQGHWQMSDQPPPEGTPYEVLEYREDVNVLPVPPQLQDQ